MEKRGLAVLAVSLLTVVSVLGAYYHFIYLPERQREEMVKLLMDYAGFYMGGCYGV